MAAEHREDVVSDYGKPIDLWCVVCDRAVARREIDGCSNGAHKTAYVYARIPEDKRPEADEPEEDAIVTHEGDWGGAFLGAGPDVSDIPRRGERWAYESPGDGWACVDQHVRYTKSLADAVLWVACGVLP